METLKEADETRVGGSGTGAGTGTEARTADVHKSRPDCRDSCSKFTTPGSYYSNIYNLICGDINYYSYRLHFLIIPCSSIKIKATELISKM